MTVAEGIRSLGFRRWHERQLIESHAYLVTGVLSMVLALSCLEDLNLRAPGARGASLLVLIVAASFISLAAFRRYLAILFRAESLAEHAVCRRCGANGAIRVLGGDAPAEAQDSVESQGGEILDVECRKCGNRWRMCEPR